MKEGEISELFNSQLDVLLEGGKEQLFSRDPGAMALAGALSRADFSGQSLIKESLRERLAAKEGGGLLEALRRLFSNNYARVAMAAAVVVVSLLPLARRYPGRVPEVAAPAGTASQPVKAPAARTSAPVSRPAAASKPARPAPAKGLFASIPMAELESEPIKDFPIAAPAALSPEDGAGEKEAGPEKGPGAVFETKSATFLLERRVITPADLFERRVI